MIAVIPLREQDSYEELRYCLRSLDKYHPGIKLIIVGPKKPDWLINCKHILFRDAEHHEWKSKNIFDKTIAAFKHARNLLFLNDDHILFAPVDYYHHKGPLEMNIAGRNPIGTYTQTLMNTYKVYGNVNDFDTHCPIWYEKENFEKLWKLDWTVPHGYGIKTSYCAANNIAGEFYPDMKFMDKIGDLTNRLYISTDDNCILNGFEKLFPYKSRFER